jgi:hypothetical protein
LGFSSIDPLVSVKNYVSFFHFRGQSTRRLTQRLINLWKSNSQLPNLRIQAYGNDVGLETNGWVKNSNWELYLGKLERANYFEELAQGGLHLCTSSVEGFGHYINESRAMSALVIALDAPPMNELINSEFGVLIPAFESSIQNFGSVYDTTEKDLLSAVQHVLSMSETERATMGFTARQHYEADHMNFLRALSNYAKRLVLRQKTLPLTANIMTSPQVVNANNDLGGVFDSIYRRNDWGNKAAVKGIYSGLGSHDPKIVSPYIEALRKLLMPLHAKCSALDIGCGDFTVGSQIRSFFGKYSACDVSNLAIDHCLNNFGTLGVDFLLLDASRDTLPRADFVLIRQVLQHLDNQTILRIIRNIENKFKYAIITEHLPAQAEFVPNLNKSSGPDIRLARNSGVRPEAEPFKMRYRNSMQLVSVPQFGGRIVTTLYELYSDPL